MSSFTFKSLRSEPEGFEVDATGVSPWTENKPEVRGGGGVRGNYGTLCIRWVLLPLAFVGFLIFAIVGTTSITSALNEQDHFASLVGGRMFPRPPPPPPVEPRGPSAPIYSESPPPPPIPRPPFAVLHTVPPPYLPPPPPSPPP